MDTQKSILHIICPLLLVAQRVKRLPAMQETQGLIPGSGRSPGEGNGNPLQYSCLEKSHGQRSLVGCSPWGHKESDTTKWLHFHFLFCPRQLDSKLSKAAHKHLFGHLLNQFYFFHPLRLSFKWYWLETNFEVFLVEAVFFFFCPLVAKSRTRLSNWTELNWTFNFVFVFFWMDTTFTWFKSQNNINSYMLRGVTSIPSPILVLPVPLSPRGKHFFINFLYIILCNGNRHENIFLYPSFLYKR